MMSISLMLTLRSLNLQERGERAHDFYVKAFYLK